MPSSAEAPGGGSWQRHNLGDHDDYRAYGPGFIIHKFSFQYNTPGLAAGIVAYTPTAGDVLLDAWIEIDTAWNGTTPLGDIGAFGQSWYWFSDEGCGAVPMNLADNQGNAGFSRGNTLNDLLQSYSIQQVTNNPGNGLYTVSGANLNLAGSAQANGVRFLPLTFLAPVTPIKVIVSTNGTTSGADPGATKGSATLFIQTATPV